MELNDCRFYSADHEMHFSVFSDAVCRARYLESIRLPIGDIRVDVYEIEPGPQSRWILTKQEEGQNTEYKWFVRKGEKFVRRACEDIPKEIKADALDKFPHLAQQSLTKAA